MMDWSIWWDDILAWGEYSVLMYSGMFDQTSGPLSQEEWLQQLTRLDFTKKALWKQARKIYFVKDSNGHDVIGGYYREDLNAKITLLTVTKGGNKVSATNVQVTK